MYLKNQKSRVCLMYQRRLMSRLCPFRLKNLMYHQCPFRLTCPLCPLQKSQKTLKCPLLHLDLMYQRNRQCPLYRLSQKTQS